LGVPTAGTAAGPFSASLAFGTTSGLNIALCRAPTTRNALPGTNDSAVVFADGLSRLGPLMPGQTRMTKAESKRRRVALIKALEAGHLGTLTLSEAARFAATRHSVIQRWLQNDPDLATAWQRAQGGFRLNDRPELPPFEEFRLRYFGHDTPEHQKAWISHIEGHPVTAIFCPPASGKTTLLLEYILYRLCANRELRFMIVCSNQVESRKRVDLLAQMLTDHHLYESNGRPSVVADFGPFAPAPGERSRPPWTRDYFSIKRSSVEKDYTIQGVGLRGKLYGSRLDFVMLDDVVEDYVPEPERERIISWLLGRVQSRLPADGKIAMLATRVHEQDLYASFLDDSNEWTATWAKLQTAALNDANESYWPELWPTEELLRRQESMRFRDWALIYQQEAIGLPDAPFPLDVLEGSRDPTRRVGDIPHGLPVVVGVDPATEGTCALVVLAIDRATRTRHIIDCIAKSGLGNREAIKSEIFYAVRRYGAIRCMVEENFGQLGTDVDLKQQLHQLGCNLLKFDTSGGKKYDKDHGVLGTAGRFAQGKFTIPAGPGSDTHMRPFIDELAIWRAGRRGKQDRVMALWFADSVAESLGAFRPGLPRRNPNTPGWVSQRRVPAWVGQRRPQVRHSAD